MSWFVSQHRHFRSFPEDFFFISTKFLAFSDHIQGEKIWMSWVWYLARDCWGWGGWRGWRGLRGLRGPKGLRGLRRLTVVGRYPTSFLECLSHQDSKNIAHCKWFSYSPGLFVFVIVFLFVFVFVFVFPIHFWIAIVALFGANFKMYLWRWWSCALGCIWWDTANAMAVPPHWEMASGFVIPLRHWQTVTTTRAPAVLTRRCM